MKFLKEVVFVTLLLWFCLFAIAEVISGFMGPSGESERPWIPAITFSLVFVIPLVYSYSALKKLRSANDDVANDDREPPTH